MLHSTRTTRTAVSERSTVFYYTLPRNCTYYSLRAQHSVRLLHSVGTARTAGSDGRTVFVCYTPHEIHVLQAKSAAPCSIITLPRNCTYCSLREQHRVLFLYSPGTAHTAVSERSTVFYSYTPKKMHVLQDQSAAPCSIFTLPRNYTYCILRAQHRVLLLTSPATARNGV